MKMICRGVAVALAALVAGAAGAPSAASAYTGCAPGFVLREVRVVLSTLAAPGSEQAIESSDRNGDGYLCVRLAPGGGLAQYTDNRA